MILSILFICIEERNENALDWICVNSDCVLNEIDESNSQYEKHDEQKI
jgi:hypothetical protein